MFEYNESSSRNKHSNRGSDDPERTGSVDVPPSKERSVNIEGEERPKDACSMLGPWKYVLFWCVSFAAIGIGAAVLWLSVSNTVKYSNGIVCYGQMLNETANPQCTDWIQCTVPRSGSSQPLFVGSNAYGADVFKPSTLGYSDGNRGSMAVFRFFCALLGIVLLGSAIILDLLLSCLISTVGPQRAIEEWGFKTAAMYQALGLLAFVNSVVFDYVSNCVLLNYKAASSFSSSSLDLLDGIIIANLVSFPFALLICVFFCLQKCRQRHVSSAPNEPNPSALSKVCPSARWKAVQLLGLLAVLFNLAVSIALLDRTIWILALCNVFLNACRVRMSYC